MSNIDALLYSNNGSLLNRIYDVYTNTSRTELIRELIKLDQNSIDLLEKIIWLETMLFQQKTKKDVKNIKSQISKLRKKIKINDSKYIEISDKL